MLQAIEPPQPEDRDESGPAAPPPLLTLAAAVGLAWSLTWLTAALVIVLEVFGVEPLSEWGAEAVRTLTRLAGASPTLIVLVQGPLAAILLGAVLAAMAGRHAARAMFAFWAWLNLGVGAMSLLFAMRLTPLGWACMVYALGTLLMLDAPLGGGPLRPPGSRRIPGRRGRRGFGRECATSPGSTTRTTAREAQPSSARRHHVLRSSPPAPPGDPDPDRRGQPDLVGDLVLGFGLVVLAAIGVSTLSWLGGPVVGALGLFAGIVIFAIAGLKSLLSLLLFAAGWKTLQGDPAGRAYHRLWAWMIVVLDVVNLVVHRRDGPDGLVGPGLRRRRAVCDQPAGISRLFLRLRRALARGGKPRGLRRRAILKGDGARVACGSAEGVRGTRAEVRPDAATHDPRRSTTMASAGNPFEKAMKLAVVTGLRAALGPALLAASQNRPERGTLAMAAMGEMVVDKLPLVPSRARLPLLLPRAAAGYWVAQQSLRQDGVDEPWAAPMGAAVAAASHDRPADPRDLAPRPGHLQPRPRPGRGLPGPPPGGRGRRHVDGRGQGDRHGGRSRRSAARSCRSRTRSWSRSRASRLRRSSTPEADCEECRSGRHGRVHSESPCRRHFEAAAVRITRRRPARCSSPAGPLEMLIRGSGP